MLYGWHFLHRSGIKYQEQLWGRGWPVSSMPWVRNLQWWDGTWHSLNYARKWKFGTNVGNLIRRTFIKISPCIQLGALKVIQVIYDDGEVVNTLLIMLETQHFMHMFGGTCDHELLGHLDEVLSSGWNGRCVVPWDEREREQREDKDFITHLAMKVSAGHGLCNCTALAQ